MVQLSTLSRTTGGTRESRTSAQLSQKVPFGPFIPVLQFNWTLLNQRPPFDVGQHGVLHYEQICYIKVVRVIKDVEQKYKEGTGKDTWCVYVQMFCVVMHHCRCYTKYIKIQCCQNIDEKNVHAI